MKSFAVVCLVLALAIATFAATGKEVTYKSGNEDVKGMLYEPQGKGPFPAIVVIHEWWGLNDWLKNRLRSWRTRDMSRLRLTYTAAMSRQPAMKPTN